MSCCCPQTALHIQGLIPHPSSVHYRGKSCKVQPETPLQTTRTSRMSPASVVQCEIHRLGKENHSGERALLKRFPQLFLQCVQLQEESNYLLEHGEEDARGRGSWVSLPSLWDRDMLYPALQSLLEIQLLQILTLIPNGIKGK